MLCRGTDDTPLQPEWFHGRCIAVLVFMQFGAPHHIVCRQTGTGFRFILPLALPLPADALPGDNGNDGGVQVWRFLVHVQHARYKVLVPKVSLSHLRLASIQLSSLPPLAISIICSCVPVRMTRMAFVWFLPTLRRNPAVSMRCCIASVRLDTPSGNLTSSRLRCVLPASALSGTYFFPLASFLSIWHDIPLSLPLPRCR